MIATQTETKPCWEKCELCEEYICNIHGEHVYDCSCEPIEWWIERSMYPYETSVQEFYDHQEKELKGE